MPTSRDSLDVMFLASQGRPVLWSGHLVHQTYESPPLHDGDQIETRFLDANGARPQGLSIDVDDGFLEIRSKTLDRIMLWTDTAPAVVTAKVITKRGAASTIRAWNCWRDEQGQINYWLGPAGMILKGDLKTGLTLRCSDGYESLAPEGEPTFADLVVSMKLINPSSNRQPL